MARGIAMITDIWRLPGDGASLRANSGLKPQEYSQPVLGLIFLRLAELRFGAQHAKLDKAVTSTKRASRNDDPAAYHAEGILCLVVEARLDYLRNRSEAENNGAKVSTGMRDIEKHNPQPAGVLPKTYNLFTSTLLKELAQESLRDSRQHSFGAVR
jgi:type I restriction enzyme M protein